MDSSAFYCQKHVTGRAMARPATTVLEDEKHLN
jgi:hypothetical protein